MLRSTLRCAAKRALLVSTVRRRRIQNSGAVPPEKFRQELFCKGSCMRAPFYTGMKERRLQ